MTGFFLGAFALMIISMIAYFSDNSYRAIIQATVLVVMVKAIASPHSPPPAYLAVGFQGLVGALLFSTIRSRKLACILLGILSMIESASQKLLITTLIFGKGIWIAVNDLFEHVMKDFHLNIHMSYAVFVICIYLFLYAVWGTIVGLWANRLPVNIIANKEEVLSLYKTLTLSTGGISAPQKASKKNKRIIYFIAILLFIIFIFIWSGADSKMILKIVLRSVAAVLLLFFVLQPIVKYFINKWLAKQSGERKQAATELIEMLPQMRKLVSPAYQLAGTATSLFKKLNYFILYLIILALYGD